MRSAAFFEDDARRKSGGGRRPSSRPVLPDFEKPADGSGSRRRAPPAEAESPVGRPSNWFHHDDRDLQAEGPSQTGARGVSREQYGDRRDSRRGERVQPAPGAPRYNKAAEWEYVDPKGVIQGPFSSKEVLKWSDAGFFQSDQQIRRAGETRFTSLRTCMPQLQRDINGPPAEQATQRSGRGGSMAHADVSYRKPRPSRSLEQAPDGSYKGHPADALMSPDHMEARREEMDTGSGRGGHDRRGAQGGPGGRGPGRDGEQGHGRRGGRGSYGDGSMRPERQDRRHSTAAAQASPEPEGPKLPHSLKMAQRLFTGDATLATDEPVWRYVDPSGQTQGPFPAKNMLEWYRRGLLNDMTLQMCGAERKVAPPDFPQPEHYRPLGTLLQSIKRGQRFHPLTSELIRQGSSVQYQPSGRGSREAKADATSAQEPRAPTARDSLPKRQTPSARGRSKNQGPTRDAASAEDSQHVSLQLAHGATEGERIKAVLSMGRPPAAPAAPAAAEALPDTSDFAPEVPRKADSSSATAGQGNDDASVSPLAAGAHGAAQSQKPADTPVLAPASQLGPGFVATPEKPSATEARSELPQASLLSSLAQQTSTDTAGNAKDARAKGPSEHGTAAEDNQMSVEAGSTAGPLAEVAAAHTKSSAVREPTTLTDADVEPEQRAPPKPFQPEKEVEFMAAEGSLSSIHVHSAPSEALDAAEKGESPAAHGDTAAAKGSFAQTATPDVEAAEKAHNVLESNIKAIEAANDSTAESLDAGVHAHGAEQAGEGVAAKDSSAPSSLSQMTRQAGESVSDASMTEPAAESPELLGMAGAGKQKAQSKESTEPYDTGANYHTLGAGEPAGNDKAADPAMASPGLLSAVAAGGQDARPEESAEPYDTGANYHTLGAGEPAVKDEAADPAMASPGLLSAAVAGKQDARPEESAEPYDTGANYHTLGAGEPAGNDKAADPAMGSPELLSGAAASGQDARPKESAEPYDTGANYHTLGAGESAGKDKAADPAMGSPELLRVAAAGGESSQHDKAAAQKVPSSHTMQSAADSASVGESGKSAVSAAEPTSHAKESPLASRSAPSKTETDTISEATQATAEMPGGAKATEPTVGSVEFLGPAKTTDAASEPEASAHPADSSTAAARAAGNNNSGSIEANTVSDMTQAVAETPGDAKAGEPAGGSVELLGAAKTTDAASEPDATAKPAFASTAAAPEGDSPKGSPLEDTFTKASPRMSPSVSRTASAGDEGGSIAGARTTSQDEGGDHGKKEHGSLFASARAFFKRKEADGKH